MSVLTETTACWTGFMHRSDLIDRMLHAEVGVCHELLHGNRILQIIRLFDGSALFLVPIM